jgi:signal transduction histidine kinase/CheY-like chemotaxis protein
MASISEQFGQRRLILVYQKFVSIYSAAMAIYYAIVTPLNFSLPDSSRNLMLICTSASSIISLIILKSSIKNDNKWKDIEFYSLFNNFVLLLNITIHTFSVRDSHLLIYFAPLALIFGLVGPSKRVIAISLAANGLAAALCNRFAPPAYASEFGTAVGTIILAAIGVAWFLHRTIAEKAQALARLGAAVESLEEARQRSAALAEEAQSAHEAKAAFIANVSHEMRSPLTGILGLTSALARTELSPQQAEIVALLKSSSDMLGRIVSDVLDLEKIAAGKIDFEICPTNFSGEVENVVKLMSPQASEKGIFLTFENADSKILYVDCDPTRVKQIFMNLISNAIKFTETGGVVVRLETTVDERHQRAGFVIEVIDTGIGFDSKNSAWLFDRFRQAEASTTRRFGGTGLGLSICRSLARAMGGDVTASSVVGTGSCFTVKLDLPISKDVQRFVEPASALASSLGVLVADDSAAVRRVIAILLAEFGCEAVFAEDGISALEAYRSNRFDVVLMDMNMPRMDGLSTVRRIRALEVERGDPEVPIVMLTGNSSDEDRQTARDAGATDFVTKPIATASLYSALTRATASRELDRTTAPARAGR